MRRKIQKYLSGEREGFSLIELIIVIAIMAILIGVVALVVLPYLESSRESTDRAALNEVATAFKSAASGNEKFAKEAAALNATGVLITGFSDDFKTKINKYLERPVDKIEEAFSSDACKNAHFYFAKDADKGFFVYLSKNGETVKDTNGTEYSSIK
ncbi:MAG: type II secretion system GspH family protein [Clostridium sp.]|nr:type II secretion system GspH family protein [Clostridium sp.]MDY4876391.1 type II secretion system protein [Eubacterium sp.]